MIKAKFTDLYRRTLYFIFSLSWVSGTVFFVLSRFCMIEGDFGPQRHPWQFPMLSIHGASAFLMIFYFGFIMASHVPITWKLKKNSHNWNYSSLSNRFSSFNGLSSLLHV
jgi:hypothetical protein